MRCSVSRKSEAILDLREVSASEHVALALTHYKHLPKGDKLVLQGPSDLTALRAALEREHPGAYSWQILEDEQLVEVELGKLTSHPLPRVVHNTRASRSESDTFNGARWRLDPVDRDLDANVIELAPESSIGEHLGPELDVLIHVISGTGQLHTETGTVDLAAGDVLYLPARSSRGFTASTEGLRYLSVHQRKRTGGLMPTRRRETS